MELAFKAKISMVDRKAKCMLVTFTAPGCSPQDVSTPLFPEGVDKAVWLRQYAPAWFWKEELTPRDLPKDGDEIDGTLLILLPQEDEFVPKAKSPVALTLEAKNL